MRARRRGVAFRRRNGRAPERRQRRGAARFHRRQRRLVNPHADMIAAPARQTGRRRRVVWLVGAGRGPLDAFNACLGDVFADENPFGVAARLVAQKNLQIVHDLDRDRDFHIAMRNQQRVVGQDVRIVHDLLALPRFDQRHGDAAAAIQAFGPERLQAVLPIANDRPLHAQFVDDVGQLRRISDFLQKKAFQLGAQLGRGDAAAQLRRVQRAHPVLALRDRFAEEGAHELQPPLGANGLGHFDDIRSALLERQQRLRRQLHVAFQRRMLLQIMKIQPVELRKLLPDDRLQRAVVIHVGMRRHRKIDFLRH
ncbi:MAG: hypothetical protein BWZ10_00785 [candidate division BRC1 bacterium ADurb.BinA364]|nr:MAG: hypothetical protein BWZ10_00785 [candidate division BRC1 bacterium ADurb.BinA364]